MTLKTAASAEELPEIDRSRSAQKRTGTIFASISSESPGPCYDVRASSSFLRKSLPAFTMKSRHAAEHAGKAPGPNQYDVGAKMRASGGYVRDKGKTYLDALIRSCNALGPGEYSPVGTETLEGKKVTGGTILSRHELTNREIRPAPNQYAQQAPRSAKSSHIFASARDPFQPSRDQKSNPGPAKYQVKDKACRKQQQDITFPESISQQKVEQTPGANAYDVKTALTQSRTPSFSMKDRALGGFGRV